jgi:DNA-binding GntR family transcriptional regulator
MCSDLMIARLPGRASSNAKMDIRMTADTTMTNPAGSGGTKPRRKRGSVAVYEELREDILWIRIEPGSALDEVALAERFDLSRTPVREALVMLASEDLVTFLPNRTTIVAPHKMTNLSEYLDTHLVLARMIARSAARTRTTEDVAHIRNAQMHYETVAASGDVRSVFGADLSLHREISKSSHNSFAQKFHDLSLDYGRRLHILHYYPEFGVPEQERSIEQHRDLVDAIAEGDADQGDAAIAQHVRSEMNAIIRSLEPKIGFNMDVSDVSVEG